MWIETTHPEFHFGKGITEQSLYQEWRAGNFDISFAQWLRERYETIWTNDPNRNWETTHEYWPNFDKMAEEIIANADYDDRLGNMSTAELRAAVAIYAVHPSCKEEYYRSIEELRARGHTCMHCWFGHEAKSEECEHE